METIRSTTLNNIYDGAQSGLQSELTQSNVTGAREWIRYMVYRFGGYTMLNFPVFVFQAPQGSRGANPPGVVWRGFSGHWMFFYSAALASLYTAAVGSEDQSEMPPCYARCPVVKWRRARLVSGEYQLEGVGG